MDSFTLARRKARAALEQAFITAGIPMDYIVLPHQDDHDRLLVVSDWEIRWIDDSNTRRIAEIFLQSPLTGVVQGQDLYWISNSREFDPTDYGFDRPYCFDLPFDLTDIHETEGNSWETLPKASMRKRKRPQVFKIIGGMNG